MDILVLTPIFVVGTLLSWGTIFAGRFLVGYLARMFLETVSAKWPGSVFELLTARVADMPLAYSIEDGLLCWFEIGCAVCALVTLSCATPTALGCIVLGGCLAYLHAMQTISAKQYAERHGSAS